MFVQLQIKCRMPSSVACNGWFAGSVSDCSKHFAVSHIAKHQGVFFPKLNISVVPCHADITTAIVLQAVMNHQRFWKTITHVCAKFNHKLLDGQSVEIMGWTFCFVTTLIECLQMKPNASEMMAVTKQLSFIRFSNLKIQCCTHV